MMVNDDYIIWLVVTGTMEWIMTFHEKLGRIIVPSDELIFFREVQTTTQLVMINML
jgi:hypothetical protein